MEGIALDAINLKSKREAEAAALMKPKKKSKKDVTPVKPLDLSTSLVPVKEFSINDTYLKNANDTVSIFTTTA